MKLGTFTISNEVIHTETAHPTVMKLMGRMIVVRAEQKMGIEGIEYTAISDYFEEVEKGSAPLAYIFTFEATTDGAVTITCEKEPT